MTPVILGISTEPATAALLERDLPRRYAADYQVMVERSPAAGLDRLRGLQAAGADVALVIADLRMDEMTGIDFLVAAQAIHPDAGRLVLIAFDRCPWHWTARKS